MLCTKTDYEIDMINVVVSSAVLTVCWSAAQLPL